MTLFEDDFEGSLSQWTGSDDGSTSATLLTDPLDSSNKAMSFNGTSHTGDAFTRLPISIAGYEQVLVEFRYLGLPVLGSAQDNYGGFLGISVGPSISSGPAAWIAGTDVSAANGLGFQGVHLVDDGTWRSYVVDITELVQNNSLTSFRLMAEDWADAGGLNQSVVGDVFFDNVKVVGVPEPASCAVCVAGLACGAYSVARRRQVV